MCAVHGSLLGDSYAEHHGLGARITFHHSSKQVFFLYWMQDFLSMRGYANRRKLKLNKQIGKKAQIYYSCKFHTFTFASLQCIVNNSYPNGKKVVPDSIEMFLSPLAIAWWIMGDGSAPVSGGLLLHTNNFIYEHVCKLVHILTQKYGWKVTVQKKKNQRILHVWKEFMESVRKTV